VQAAGQEGSIVTAGLSRRAFVGAGAAAGAGLLFLRFVGSNVSEGLAQATAGDVKWRPNVCNLCPSFCGIKVAVKDVGGQERAVKIEGDPGHSFNQGHTCARGQSGLRLLYSPDRIKKPLIRVKGSKRGEWSFRAVSWDEAYKHILQTARDNQIMPWEMTAMGGWQVCSLYGSYMLPFMRASQIPNLVGSTIQRCMYGQVLGLDSLLGTFNAHDEVSSDYANVKFGINFRSNAALTASTGRIVSFTEGLANGATVVTLDPRLTEAARPSDTWLPIKPGTDGAFLLAVMHELLTAETYDKEFLAIHTNAPFLAYEDGKMLRLAMDVDASGTPTAFYVCDEKSGNVVAVPGVSNRNDKTVGGASITPKLDASGTWNGKNVKSVLTFLKERTKQYTPEWASTICDIDAKKIASVTKQFSETRPAMIYSGWADGRYDTSPMTWKTAAMIQALVGGIDRPGGWYYTGRQHQLIKDYWDAKRKGEATLEPSLPGIKLPLVRQAVFNDAKQWAHGHPGISEVWNENRRALGKPAVPLNLFTDLGMVESVEGKLTYNGKPYLTKAIGVAATNPVRSFYSSDDQKAMFTNDNVKLVMVIDVLPTDTAAYADVILPDLTYLERPDVLMDSQSADLTFATRTPAVAPVVDGKHMLDIFFDFAERMGSYDEYVRILAVNFGADPAKARKTFDTLRRSGRSVALGLREMVIANEAPGLGTTAQEMSDSLKKGAITVRTREELVAEGGVPYVYPAPTPSGRIELYSLFFASLIDGAGGYDPYMDPLLTYSDTVFREGLSAGESLANDEFFITYGHIPTMTHTSTSDNDLLVAITEQKPDMYMRVWMNRQRAEALGIKDNDTIALKNTTSGQVVDTPVFVTDLIRPDTLFFPAPFGAENKAQTTAVGLGAAWNKLVHRQIESIAAGTMASQFTVKVSMAAEGKA
jgi:anaerobic selenocysteine-containing dehydrogenase